jgi:hypothetical protein
MPTFRATRRRYQNRTGSFFNARAMTERSGSSPVVGIAALTPPYLLLAIGIRLKSQSDLSDVESLELNLTHFTLIRVLKNFEQALTAFHTVNETVRRKPH